MKLLRWLGKYSLISFITLFIFLFLLEIAYRYQWFDFYKTEITELNKEALKKQYKKRVLVFGDSFSAATDGYVAMLNDSLPDVQFINASMPGIGPQEIAVIAADRIEASKPDMVIIELFHAN